MARFKQAPLLARAIASAGYVLQLIVGQDLGYFEIE
jgi:hypothetical protein